MTSDIEPVESKHIDMSDIIHVNKTNNDFVLRYCASEQSLPKNAKNISAIFGISQKTGHTTTFNKLTGLPFGFSYEINKGDDVPYFRKIEHDIIIGKAKPTIDEQNYLYSYDEFIKYYYDEKFSEPCYDYDEDDKEEYDDSYDENEKPIENYTHTYDDDLDTFIEEISSDEDHEDDE